jgi:hypothetical protein
MTILEYSRGIFVNTKYLEGFYIKCERRNDPENFDTRITKNGATAEKI